MTHENNNQHAGFTLLELLLVLSIIGIAAAVVIPRLGSSDNTRMQSEIRELVATLNYARRMALIQGQETTVKLYPAANNAKQAAAPKPKRPGQWYAQHLSIEAKKGPSANSDEDLSSFFIVHFYPGGGSSGGDFVLKGGDLTARLQIDALTGKLKAEFEDE